MEWFDLSLYTNQCYSSFYDSVQVCLFMARLIFKLYHSCGYEGPSLLPALVSSIAHTHWTLCYTVYCKTGQVCDGYNTDSFGTWPLPAVKWIRWSRDDNTRKCLLG